MLPRGGLIGFVYLLIEFGTRSNLGWTWPNWSQGAWEDGGMQEHLGGHLYGFFTPFFAFLINKLKVSLPKEVFASHSFIHWHVQAAVLFFFSVWGVLSNVPQTLHM